MRRKKSGRTPPANEAARALRHGLFQPKKRDAKTHYSRKIKHPKRGGGHIAPFDFRAGNGTIWSLSAFRPI